MKKVDVRKVIGVACVFRLFSSLVSIFQTADFFVLSRWVYLLQTIFLRSVVEAYLYMPGMVFFTKMVPHSIEASMLGITMSIIKFNTEVLSRVWAYLLNLYFGVEEG